MEYRIIKAHRMTEEQLRELWSSTYCKEPIYTFDGIWVRFFDDMFDHAFYESANWAKKDKSILSYNRLEKMLWIKAVLLDPEAILKEGWDKKSKKYIANRRLAMIKGNYVVIISLVGEKKARFITAYEIQEEENIQKIKESPDWVKK